MTADAPSLPALKKARSLLLILLTTCRETILALEAAANALDSDLTTELTSMVSRSEAELKAIEKKIAELNGSE